MNEKRCCDCEHFGLSKDPIFKVLTGICGRCGKEVGYTDQCLFEEVCEKLNEQESTIISLKERNKQLRRRLEKINGGYGHLTHRKGLTANEWVIERQEKELRKKNEQISDWIERHSKDIVKIGEQRITISTLKEENEQLRKQIQNYEKLIANSYVGEQERLDGWVGQYVIWEDELQKYRKKVMNDE